MCSILASFSQNPRKIDTLLRALKLSSARGPDASGYSVDGGLFLGHNLLNICDQSRLIKQPMQVGGFSIIFNGEIYNHAELRGKLIKRGHSFSTKSDTETLLHAYIEHGANCLEMLNGPFAFVIYDKSKEELFCARDRFGVKPFYYYFKSGEFIASSLIAPILSLLESAKPNYQTLINYIIRAYGDYDSASFFKDISKLPAAHFLRLSLKSAKIKLERYYTPERRPVCAGESYSELRGLLESSLELRLRSELPVAAMLSGGLDSSAMLALAAKHRDITPIHIKSSLSSSDESEHAKAVVSAINAVGGGAMALEIFEPSTQDFLDSTDELFSTLEEPFVSSSYYMEFFAMRVARELGFRVILSGQGSDEIFFGYEYYHPYICSALGLEPCEYIKKAKLYRMSGELLESEIAKLNSPGLAFDRINNGSFAPGFLNKSYILEMLSTPKDSFEFGLGEVYQKGLPGLLKFEDRNSMHFGVESRHPFLDYRVVEYALNLPLEQKYRDGYLKYPLRAILKEQNILPKSIIWRYNKFGFEAPEKPWLQAIRTEMLECIGGSAIIKHIFQKCDIRRDDFLWKLFCIARWERQFSVEVE